jgi:D-sedoheptulose 7-phosphate isomerase
MMEDPGRYKALVLSAIQCIDLTQVGQAIQIFNAAREQGRRIFVCGDAGAEATGAHLLCDLVKSSNYSHPTPFRILALREEMPKLAHMQDERTHNRLFVEQLKDFAEPEDVLMGICVSGNSPRIVNAIDYAAWIGCHTIGVTGFDGGKVAQLAELNIQVPVTHLGSVEDALVVICHMIGHCFAGQEIA